MDQHEKRVKSYLISQGISEQDIRFEPDGNVPPDFLIKGQIAIEVRRLNQNIRGESLEERSIPLFDSVSKILTEFNGRIPDKTYFFSLRYKRPLPNKTQIKEITKSVLDEFCVNPSDIRIEIPFDDNLAYVITPATFRNNITFLMRGNIDLDRGGWILHEMEKNIQYCSDEKNRKIKKYKHKYKTWWLALIDHISHGLDNCEQKLFAQSINIEHDWDKIIIINPNESIPIVEI